MVDNIFQSELAIKQPVVTQLLSNAVGRGRLAHAYLLVVRAQKDKLGLALNLACFLNCANVAAGRAELACYLSPSSQFHLQESCQNCRWILEQKHPQAWLTLGSEGTKSGKIPVEKARNLGDELAKESQYLRMVVIEDASSEIFHRPAANALLKTIEAPKVNCVFMLFAVSVEEVLPTVVSRCQVLMLKTSESAGLSLQGNDLTAYDQQLVHLAQDVVDRHMHRQDSRALSDLLAFNKELGDLFGDGITPSDAIDLLVGLELERIAVSAMRDNAWSSYAKSLLKLSETTKRQLDHSVSSKAAMESFTLSWWRIAMPTIRVPTN